MALARRVLWEGAGLPLSPRPAWADGRFNLVTCLAILPRGRDTAGLHADTNNFCSPCDGGLPCPPARVAFEE